MFWGTSILCWLSECPPLPELEVSHQTRESFSLSSTLPSCHRNHWVSFRGTHGHGVSQTHASSAPFPFISALKTLHRETETAPNPTRTTSGELVSLPFSPSVETDTLTQFVLHLGCPHSAHWWHWVQLYLWWPKNSTQLTLHFKNWKISQKSILFFFFCFITFYSNNTQACRKHDG